MLQRWPPSQWSPAAHWWWRWGRWWLCPRHLGRVDGQSCATHQGVLAIGPHIEHVKEAVTKQRRLDAKLVKIKSQLEWFLILLLMSLIIRLWPDTEPRPPGWGCPGPRPGHIRGQCWGCSQGCRGRGWLGSPGWQSRTPLLLWSCRKCSCWPSSCPSLPPWCQRDWGRWPVHWCDTEDSADIGRHRCELMIVKVARQVEGSSPLTKMALIK